MPPMPPPGPRPSPAPAPKPPQPKPLPTEEAKKPKPAPEEQGGSKKQDRCQADLDRLIKAMEELAKGLEAMGKDILCKVDTLESQVTRRSDEIRKDVKNMHQDAVDFSRKIKDAMHDAALKDLEIQKMTMELIDQAEDKALERAVKSQGLFGGKSG